MTYLLKSMWRYLFLIVFQLMFSGLYSQITAPYADYSDLVSYTVSGGPDSIFFFSSKNSSTFLIADTARFQGYNYSWELFNPASGYVAFSTNERIDVVPDTIAQGYRLTAWNDTDTQISRCWLMRNAFDARITTKDEEGNLSIEAYTSECDVYGPIQVQMTQSQLIYYHPETREQIVYKPRYSMVWTKEQDVPEGRIVSKGSFSNNYKYNVENAYWEDMWYTIEIKDSSGTSIRDSVNVRSINPKADFEYTYIQLDDKTFYPDKDTNYYFFYSSAKKSDAISAPAQFIFTSKSKNAHQLVWNFADSTLPYRTVKDSVIKEFNKWGTFKVSLTAEHHVKWWTQTCTDVFSLTEAIKIDQPKLIAPNAFCINSSYYPAWRFEDVSITDFEISIFSRNGVRVHHFEGNIHDWNGWDGKYRNSDSYVSDGVYFYAVKNYSAIHNIDKNTSNPPVWGGTKTDSDTDSGSGDTTGDSSSKGKRDLSNSEYRGFIHVFCSE